MTASGARQLLQNRLLQAGACGLLLAAAFPQAGIAALAWLAPGLWLLCARELPHKRAFAVGYAGGLTFNLAALYWLNLVPYPVTPTIGWLALAAYLALYPAVWVAVTVSGFGFRVPDFELRRRSSANDHVRKADDSSWFRRALWCVFCALVWVALETVMGRLLTGFPWLLLGNSQYQILPLIQIASVTGLAGVSFLMVWTSTAVVCTALTLLRHPERPWAWFSDVAPPLLVLAGVLGFGVSRLASRPDAGKELSLALIQPSIPQTVKWDPDANQRAFAKVLDLSRAALALKPDILVWPEAATPGYLRYNRELHDTVTGLAREHNVWIILGADDAAARADDPERADYFNSAFLVSPEGRLLAKYDKQRLVIFGEYVPLAKWLPLLKWFTPVEGGFTPGKGPVQFEIEGLGVKAAPLICFEDVFAFHTRRYVEPDTDFLLNLTNDGWFGEAAAQWQHAAMSVFRAVENGLPMVRCTNNGLTCWIDARGRMHEVHFGNSKDIYGAGFKMARVPVAGNGTVHERTFYRRYGDWFGWTCVVAAALACGARWMQRTRTR